MDNECLRKMGPVNKGPSKPGTFRFRFFSFVWLSWLLLLLWLFRNKEKYLLPYLDEGEQTPWVLILESYGAFCNACPLFWVFLPLFQYKVEIYRFFFLFFLSVFQRFLFLEIGILDFPSVGIFNCRWAECSILKNYRVHDCFFFYSLLARLFLDTHTVMLIKTDNVGCFK